MIESNSARQTMTFLRRRLQEAGIRPHAKIGQNFLIDLNLLQILLNAAQLTTDDVVLEIGTGMDSLTALLAPLAAAVVTVEIDPRLFQLAGEELHALKNVVMLRADALKNKNQLNPQIIEEVQSLLDCDPRRRFKLLANLPYNVATPVLSNLLALARPPESMTVTIQKELADRIVAKPGTKDYSALSIWVQSQCRAEMLRELPPAVFWPRPKVSSAFLQITFDELKRARILELEFFHQFIRALFFHRRKYLRAQLFTAAGRRLEKNAIDAILQELKLSPRLRAEQLDVETIIALSNTLRKSLV
ncbi:MAG: 16S rRNA (adenine(1518)-N(6)/adenine(1519)-N(6))-dimethyltransferase RsmA [Thermoguttaceae bacterium]